jgi:hypothetical protein
MEAPMLTRFIVIPLTWALTTAPSPSRTDEVLDWNAIMAATVATQNPFAQARVAAITQLAVFEAVNACTERYRPYLGIVTAPADASAEAAAVAAAHGVLKHYFPGNAAALDAARAQSLAAIEDGGAKANGIAVGEAAAAALVAARLGDGATPPQTFLPESTDAGVWQPTPPTFGAGILFHWQNVRTFGLERSDQFRSAPPPQLSSRRYARDYHEVMSAGSTSSTVRPQHGTDVARYFAVVSAMDAWNSAARQVIATRHRSLAENARFLALMNMAISDGLVSSMETKYFYQLWRPVTAIVNGGADDNPRTDADAGWLPLVTTPAFPSYPSAHASASYAARDVAERLLGRHHIRFELSHPGVPGVLLSYESFEDLTDDIDRVWWDPLPIRSGCGRHAGPPGRGVRGDAEPATASSMAALDWEVEAPDRCPGACPVLRLDSRSLLLRSR